MTTTTARTAFDPEAPENSRRNVAILLFTVAAIVLVASLTNWLGALVVITALFAIIMLHEFGHFVMAKRAGMKVTEFFIGFGPRLWSVRKGETEYGVKALPLGGYVRIIGMSNLETVAPEDEPRSYRQQPFGARLGVAVAGSTVHMILAFVLFWATLTFVGLPDKPVNTIRTFTADSAAQAAGLHKGDKIVGVDGHVFGNVEDFRSYVATKAGVPVEVLVDRGGRRLTVTVTPHETLENGKKVGRFGYLLTWTTKHYGPVAALGRSAQGVGDGVVASVKALGGFFAPHSLQSYSNTLSNPTKSPGGATSSGGSGSGSDGGLRFLSPLGIGQVADQAANAGVRAVLTLLISINLFVGVFNMFPLLPLDGGHVVIAVYERIRSRRGRRYFADVRKMLPYSAALVMVLGFILVTSVYLDVRQPVNFFP
jgi:membrane-associated protease RseP (regulator of RpoE activity)